MSFGGFERGTAPSQPMAEINVTPLVDVMLVLLVIFIITAPLLAAAIRIDLPNEKAQAVSAETPAVRVAIDADGTLYWEGQRIAPEDLAPRLQEAAKRQPRPDIHLRADKQARYAQIAAVMAAAQQAGLGKIGFITEPPDTADAAK
jgi:biopolymer transport protein ExbD